MCACGDPDPSYHEQQVGKRGALEKVDDRRTPRSLFDPLNAEHQFTLDAAASPLNALCPRYFWIENDGLMQRWDGRVWCNPPYSDCGAWVRKAHFESAWCEVIVMLLPANRTEQSWWQEYVEPYRDRYDDGLTVRFLPGRLRFDVPEGTYSDPRGNRPPFGCVLLTWLSTAGDSGALPDSPVCPPEEEK